MVRQEITPFVVGIWKLHSLTTLVFFFLRQVKAKIFPEIWNL